MKLDLKKIEFYIPLTILIIFIALDGLFGFSDEIGFSWNDFYLNSFLIILLFILMGIGLIVLYFVSIMKNLHILWLDNRKIKYYLLLNYIPLITSIIYFTARVIYDEMSWEPFMGYEMYNWYYLMWLIDIILFLYFLVVTYKIIKEVIKKIRIQISLKGKPKKPKKRIIAYMFAFTLGTFGAQKFYLGKYFKAFLYLIFFWTFIPLILGIIEGIQILSFTDKEFGEKYNVNVLPSNNPFQYDVNLTSNKTNKAEEIDKLYSLFQKGAITEEEYQDLKKEALK